MPRSGPSPLATLNPLSRRRLVVIDPGSRILKLLETRARLGRVRVRRRHTVDLAREGVLGVEETRRHLESLFPQLPGLDRAVLIPQDRVICQTVDVPVEGEVPAREYLLREARRISGLEVGAFSYGFARLNPFGRYRNPWWMALCKQEEIDEIIARFLAGDELAGELGRGGLCEITTTAQALFAASRRLRSRPRHAVLVECRSQMTVVALLVNGQGCFATSLPTGCWQLAEACARDDGVLPEDAAEALRKGPAFDAPGPQLRQAIEVWHASVQTAVREWLEDNPELDLKLEELPAYVCGSGAEGGGLLQAGAKLGPLKLHPWRGRIPGLRGDPATFWVAYGLALHTLRRSGPSLSLLPAELDALAKRRRRWRRWQRLNMVLLLLLGVTLGLSIFFKREQLRRKEARLNQAQEVLRTSREMVLLYQRIQRDYVALHPVLQREQNTLDIIEALAALRKSHPHRAYWYVLLGDAATYAAGTTLPPALYTTNQATLPADPAVKPREYIAELCIPREGGGPLSTLSDIVNELRQRRIFRNVDALPPERRRNLVSPSVVVTNRVYALSLEMAGEAPPPPRALTRPAVPKTPDAKPAARAARSLPAPLRVHPKPVPPASPGATNR